MACLFLPAFFSLGAQDADFSEWDIDSLFDEPVLISPAPPSIPPAPPSEVDEPPPTEDGDARGIDGAEIADAGILSSVLRQRGFTLNASYSFFGGIFPGWEKTPWHGYGAFSSPLGGKISAGLGLDVQISETLRAKSSFEYSLPDSFSLKEFFFDYNLRNTVFIRAGKYETAWGISPNFQFANLLSRVPDKNAGGDAIMVKADIPIGIGGLQLLALTRSGFLKSGGKAPGLDEIGFGGKYNMAFPWADIDMGLYFYDPMPLRGFVSVTTTLGNTAIYAEGMASIEHKTMDDLHLSATLGFLQSFFSGKLRINGEVFFNGESDSWLFRPPANLQDAVVSPLIKDINTALNVSYKPGGFMNLRFFTQLLCAFGENTTQLVPGFTFDPLPHTSVYFAVPMALGRADGTYYTHNADVNNRPFSIVLLVSISGDYSWGVYK
ncbi:MAG: hypothetical protein LBN21_08855 [Treponema sp.]|nr:hypothetical protein [Treponema sp.]